VILWNDFVLDPVFGPLLIGDGADGDGSAQRREQRLGSPSVMEDARTSTIQETGQELRPARMVGYSSLESIAGGMDANPGNRAVYRRQREGE
jgi:hypothetical protein